MWRQHSVDAQRSLEDAVHRTACHSKDSGYFRAGVFGAEIEENEAFPGRRGLGPLAAQSALGLGDLHVLARAGTDGVGLELRDLDQ